MSFLKEVKVRLGKELTDLLLDIKPYNKWRDLKAIKTIGMLVCDSLSKTAVLDNLSSVVVELFRWLGVTN